MTLIWALTLGLSLSVCAGFRAIIPLLCLGLSHRLAPSFVPLSSNFEWLTSSPALIALGCAAFAEVLADKIPAVDTLADTLQTPIRTAAGAIVVVAPLAGAPKWALALLFLIGGASALTVHGAKSSVRVASTATTGGAANPFLSLLEDLGTLLLCILAILLAPVVFFLTAYLFYRIVRAFLSFWRKKPEAAEPEAEAAAAS